VQHIVRFGANADRTRERDEIGDEAMRRLLRETDLRKRAAEGDASPGGAPPKP